MAILNPTSFNAFFSVYLSSLGPFGSFMKTSLSSQYRPMFSRCNILGSCKRMRIPTSRIYLHVIASRGHIE